MHIAFLLLLLFWSVGPGLIAMWVFGEWGRSRVLGLLLGLAFGPLGVISACVLVKVLGPAAGGVGGGVRAARVFYDVPLIGRLHASSVWGLAGIATFLCAWGSGGIGYEVHLTLLRGDLYEMSGAPARASDNTPPAGPVTAADDPYGAGPARPQGLFTARQTPPPLANSLAPAAEVRLDTDARAEPPAGPVPSDPHAEPERSATQQPSPRPQAAEAAAPASGPQSHATPAPRTTVASSQSAVAEATRRLASGGHRVHASLSGDSQTSTLSLSGATLTRATGNQLLSNGRLREELKASGIRIVVLINGSESWTYIL